MRRYLLGIVAVVTLAIIVAGIGIGAAIADGGANPNDHGDSSARPDAIFQLSVLAPKPPVPFAQTGYTGSLHKLLPDDLDILVYINAGTADVSLEIKAWDCCILGDTLWLRALSRKTPEDPFTPIATDVCPSPARCLIETPFPVGSAVVAVVGYLDTVGGFPAAYEIVATAKVPESP